MAPMSTPAKRSVKPPRVWQRMLSGRRLDLAHPSPVDVEIEDIAHGLARVARWNGQTRGGHAFSVAEHSVIVESICRELNPDLTPRDCLTALLHDSPEYVIGDMISPFKALLGESYKSIEARLQEAIHIRFELVPVTAPEKTHQTGRPYLRLVRSGPTRRLLRGGIKQAVRQAAGRHAHETEAARRARSAGSFPCALQPVAP